MTSPNPSAEASSASATATAKQPLRRARYRTRNQRTHAVVGALLNAQTDFLNLGDATGMTLRDLAKWSTDDDNLHVLRGLVRLADLRTQLLISRFRAAAAYRLLAFASSDTASETARKACHDLLTTNMNAALAVDERTATDAPAPPIAISEEAVRLALEELERQDALHHDDANEVDEAELVSRGSEPGDDR